MDALTGSLLFLGALLVVAVIILLVIRGDITADNQKLKAEIAEKDRTHAGSAKQMAIPFLQDRGYLDLVIKAADEFVESGSLEGPACEAWQEVIAFIRNDKAWMDAAIGLLEQSHKTAQNLHKNAALSIFLEVRGGYTMSMPSYVYTPADESGKPMKEQQARTKVALLEGISQPGVASVLVKKPNGEYLGGTPEVIRVALG
ncbi:MAG: hypothetical protein A2172_02570 [Candidatus Woykebacteria bacterium RBG_13_40_15]|uniref:Uncharacterized protein n=1 Tax=Candidatus Woykebacteria bacterium RBG_13_40_15 TaxID=1802593 RepID=A0A1G1W6F8_9BACT|nr:MAG: hypothetical protein A2172_02570 [Candidatus Woykebacteria bacterium RBG_13_40_15]